MRLAQSLFEYSTVESLAESAMYLRARGDIWFDKWGTEALVIGAICVGMWVALQMAPSRRRS